MKNKLLNLILSVFSIIVFSNQAFALGETCAAAYPLQFNNCVSGTNTIYNFNGQLSSCSNSFADQTGVFWFVFTAPNSGNVKINSNADFNDQITIYNGNCNSLSEVVCSNKDEYGFTGEEIRASLNPGAIYYVRLNGVKSEYGIDEGQFCLEISEGFLNQSPITNNICNEAKSLTIDAGANCANEHNVDANINQIPEKNVRSRASLWYQFVAPADGKAHIVSNSAFADVIQLNEGTCAGLAEVAIALDGYELFASDLVAGNTYFVQLTGFFSQLEGQTCLEVKSIPAAPPNNICADAPTLTLNAVCQNGTLSGADTDSNVTDCMAYSGPSVWYKVFAPSGGQLALDIEADFPYNVAAWKGDCNDLEKVDCRVNQSNCDGYTNIEGGTSFVYYYIRVSASQDYDFENGDFCISVYNGNNAPPATKLTAELDFYCFANGTSEISIDVAGGAPPYTYYGNKHGDLIDYANIYQTTIVDSEGCSVALEGVSTCKDYTLQCPNVTDLTMVDFDEDFASFAWTSNGTAGSYLFQYKPIGSTTWTEYTTTIPYVILGGLTGCTDYEARLVADCDGLLSGYESVIDFSTSGCEACPVPAGLFTYNITASSAIVTWDIIPNASNYHLEYRVLGNTEWLTYDTFFPLVIFNALPECTNIEWRLAVECINGLGSVISPIQLFNTTNCKTDEDDIESSISANDRIMLYPNPVKDYLVVGLPSIEASKITSNIYTVGGQLIESFVTEVNQYQAVLQLDKAKYSSGMYRAEISIDGESFSKSFIVE